jgi:hypothetical protein
MTENTETADLQMAVPTGWLMIDPPDGVSLIAVDPEPMGEVRANLVVTTMARPDGLGPVTADLVDEYLNGAVERLSAELDQFELIAGWTTSPAGSRSPTQRLLGHHCVEGATVEMIQQHVWVDDVVVVVTATVPLGIDERLTEVLNECLESVATAAA